jgi:CBS domain-containing protein
MVLVSKVSSAMPLIVDDLDVVQAAVAQGNGATAADLAREPVAAISADATLADALSQMALGYATHLLVTDPATGEPSGVLSSLDLAAIAGGHDPHYTRMLRPAPARPSCSALRLSAAKVGDVMHPGVVTCGTDVPLSAVADTLAAHRLHCVAITGVAHSGGRDHRLSWDLMSDIDLIVALHRYGPTALASTATEGPPTAVEDTEPVDRAASLMLEHDTRHLPVVGATGVPVGILSTLDVLRIVAANDLYTSMKAGL